MSELTPAWFYFLAKAFNLTQGGITPGEVTRQIAYDNGPTVQLGADPWLINSSVADGGKQLISVTDKGVSLQAPIYSLLASNLDLTPDLSGTIFQNSASEIANTVTLITDADYAQNTAIFVWANGSQTLFVVAQAGVTLDGVDGATLTVLPSQFWAIYQIAPNNFQTINLQPIAQDGIEYTNGILRLTGSGASTAYNYMSGPGLNSSISFTDQGHYFIPFAGNSPPPIDRGANLAAFNDGNSHVGVQNVGTETGVFTIITKCQFKYIVGNTNTNSNDYMMCGCIGSPQPAGGPDGSFAPIDLILSPYSSYSDKQFTVFPGLVTDVVFPVQVQLASGQVYYPLARNAGPTNDPSLNRIVMTSFSFTDLKAGDTGGTSAGVSSLNSLTDDVDLTSPDLNISLVGNNVSLPLATVNSNVGNFGSATQVAAFTVNAKGLVTAASNVTITGVSPGGSAGGVLKGSYPSPQFENNIGIDAPTSDAFFYLNAVTSFDKACNEYRVNTVNYWRAGLYPAASGAEYAIVNAQTSAIALFIDPVSNVITLPGLNASQLIGTNSSKQLVSGNFTGDFTTAGFVGTISNNAVTNAKIANTTIDLTTKVTGILPNSNTTGTSANTASAIVARDSNGDFSAGIGSFSGLKVSGLAASYPAMTDASKNLISTNIATTYAFGTTKPTVDSNADTSLTVLSSVATASAQLSVAPFGAGSFFSIFSGRTSDTNSSMIWALGTDFRFGTATSLATAGYAEKFRMGTNGDFTVQTGNLIVNTAGKTLKIKQGTNACSGTGAVMVAGAVTVNTTAAATGDIIFVMKTAAGGVSTTGMPVITIANGTSFTLTGGASDTSTWSWTIFKAA